VFVPSGRKENSENKSCREREGNEREEGRWGNVEGGRVARVMRREGADTCAKHPPQWKAAAWIFAPTDDKEKPKRPEKTLKK